MRSNLDDLLYPSGGQRSVLTEADRTKVVIDVASGISYVLFTPVLFRNFDYFFAVRLLLSITT
jgi:hypothetical protein